ncbi:MAG: hypothetical protein C5B51_24005 [Terriglobia bacterium]|nr:MAG: hypothetical protein C5B51_24005 [Terriglobia bacterium]
MSRLILLGSVAFFTLGAAGMPDRGAWDTLRETATSPNPDHRRQALTALGTIGAGNAEAVQLVEAGLHDKDPVVRQTAATVLGTMKATDAIPLLEQALDDHGEVAFAAAKALADMGDEQGKGVLIGVLTGQRKDTPGLLTQKVREAKQKIRHPEQLGFMGAKEASGALLGPASLGIVAAQEAFKDGGAPGRALAATYLARDSDPYALTLLEWALADTNWGVRAAAAKALGERGNSASIGKLEPLLKDGHHAVRVMAAASIVRLTNRTGTEIQSADRTRP